MAKIEGAGGTSGGIATFLIGLGMTIAGGFLFLNHVQVGQGFWSFWGRNSHGFGGTHGFGSTQGLILIPLIIGIGFLFFNGKSIIGWVLAGGGMLIIFLAVISSLRFYFARTSLFNLLVMLVLLVGGLGLIVRSLRAVKQ